MSWAHWCLFGGLTLIYISAPGALYYDLWNALPSGFRWVLASTQLCAFGAGYILAHGTSARALPDKRTEAKKQ